METIVLNYMHKHLMLHVLVTLQIEKKTYTVIACYYYRVVGKKCNKMEINIRKCNTVRCMFIDLHQNFKISIDILY